MLAQTLQTTSKSAMYVKSHPFPLKQLSAGIDTCKHLPLYLLSQLRPGTSTVLLGEGPVSALYLETNQLTFVSAETMFYVKHPAVRLKIMDICPTESQGSVESHRSQACLRALGRVLARFTTLPYIS